MFRSIQLSRVGVIAILGCGLGLLPSDQQVARADPPRHTNRLIDQTSPYLLQHAHNPVNWYPWLDEAFKIAREQNKPIFLSVGYSTCYWCHVMEVESFENEEVAQVLNRHFVCIKVDREERPDIDQQYMMVTQMMTRRGGWPNSVWLTPDGKPWMSATYLPKDRFISILEQLAELWRSRREDVEQQAAGLADAVRRATRPSPTTTLIQDESTVLASTVNLPAVAAAHFSSRFDSDHGGFGPAPKFPPHSVLRFLSDRYLRTRPDQGTEKNRAAGDATIKQQVTATLDAMWQGGLHDHLGGGFHRYSTDAHWLLPHFEKMLYDNAQLMRAYVDGYQIDAKETYRAAVADIFFWLRGEMTSPEGGFYSAIDSGEVGKEGEAYVWKIDQVQSILSGDQFDWFASTYGLRREGNFHDESTGKLTGANILSLTQPLETTAKRLGVPADPFRASMQSARGKLLAERRTWPQPHKDDKILTSWNGLMIGALAYAGRIMDKPEYTSSAISAADFLLNQSFQNGKLYRSYRLGQIKQLAYLDDHAFFLEGLLELHQTTQDSRWLDSAEKIAGAMISRFEDEDNGGFFFTSAEHETLLLRSKHLSGGGNLPDPNAVAATTLMELSDRTGNPTYRKSARRTILSLASLMASQPGLSEDLLRAVPRLSLADLSAEHADAAPPGKALDKIPSAAPVEFKTQQIGSRVQLKLSTASERIKLGETTTFTLRMTIDEGWHLYGDNPEADFLQPVRVTAKSADGLLVGEINKPDAKNIADKMLGRNLEVFAGTVEYKIPVTAGADSEPGTKMVDIEVLFQACDDKRCLSPSTVVLRQPIEIVSPSRPPLTSGQ